VVTRSLVNAVALSVGLTFAASGVAKLRDTAAFAEGVGRYGILPARVARHAAFVIIGLELAIAAGFASGVFVRWTSLVALALLAAFALAVTINLRRGRELPCMCFGSRSQDPISAWSLIRMGLLACGVVVVLLRESATGSSLYGGRGETPEQVFVAFTLALGIIAIVRWVLVAPAVVRLFRSEGRRA
jgi:uncharacterized membrane protein YphA (DoxX/SURF4 family)